MAQDRLADRPGMGGGPAERNDPLGTPPPGTPGEAFAEARSEGQDPKSGSTNEAGRSSGGMKSSSERPESEGRDSGQPDAPSAGGTLGQAAEAARDQADAAKDEAAAGLAAFSDALKAARSELSDRKLGFAGDMLTQAADGLEGFSRTLEGRSSAEMLEAVRDFGRRNPMGFIAGSVLAGFALGRVAAAGGVGLAGQGVQAGAGHAPQSKTGRMGSGYRDAGQSGAGQTSLGMGQRVATQTGMSQMGMSQTGTGGAPVRSPSASAPDAAGGTPSWSKADQGREGGAA